MVLDQLLKEFYKKFSMTFEGCEIGFKRELMVNSYFVQCLNTTKSNFNYEGCEFIKDKSLPVISKANKKASKLYFILSGQVHVMNSGG